jgi:hypothetical protein
MIVSGEKLTSFIVYAVVNMTYAMTSEVLYYPFQKFTCKVVIKVLDMIYLVVTVLFIDTEYGRKRIFFGSGYFFEMKCANKM